MFAGGYDLPLHVHTTLQCRFVGLNFAQLQNTTPMDHFYRSFITFTDLICGWFTRSDTESPMCHLRCRFQCHQPGDL